MLGKISADDILKYFYYFFQKIGFWHFMQIVSSWDNLHEISKLICLEKKSQKNIINLSSAEFVLSGVTVDNSCAIRYNYQINPVLENPLITTTAADRQCNSNKILILTLKMPRKSASKNVVCLCRLLHILANFSTLFYAYRQTVWTQIRLLLKEQSDLGPHCLQKWL